MRLGWGLREEHAALGRILELVATSDAVRSEGQNTELTELLRARVEEFHSADPSSGYAAHLAAALDYRQWHEVKVTILGPEEGQQRRLSRRAKVRRSGGSSAVTTHVHWDGHSRHLRSTT